MQIDKMASGAAYGTSLANILTSLLGAFTYEQWNAIGVLVGIFIGVLTYATNLAFKIRDDRRKERANHGEPEN